MDSIEKYLYSFSIILSILLVSEISSAYTLLTPDQITKKINGYDKQILILEQKDRKITNRLDESNVNLKNLNNKHLDIEKEYQRISQEKKTYQADIYEIKQQRDKEINTISSKILESDFEYQALLKKDKEISEQLTKDDNMRKAMAIRLETINFITSLGADTGRNISFSELIYYGMNKEYPNIKVAYVSIDFMFEEFAPEKWVWKGSAARELLTGKKPERKIKRWLKECREPIYKFIKTGTLGNLTSSDRSRFTRLCETGQYVSTDVVVDFISQRASYEKAMDVVELSYPKTLKIREEHRKTIASKKDQASDEAKKSININTYNEYSSKIKELEKKLEDTDPDDIRSVRDKSLEDIKNTKNTIINLQSRKSSITKKLSNIRTKKTEWEKNLENAIIHEKSLKD